MKKGLNRYLVFEIKQYYPEGGMKDFIGDFKNLDDAVIEVSELLKEKKEYTGYDIYDTYIRDFIFMS